jgi:hypothetical protein
MRQGFWAALVWVPLNGALGERVSVRASPGTIVCGPLTWVPGLALGSRPQAIESNNGSLPHFVGLGSLCRDSPLRPLFLSSALVPSALVPGA